MLDIFEFGEEKDKLDEKLNDLSMRWNVVKLKVENCKVKVEEVLFVVKIYYDLLKLFFLWMIDLENWVLLFDFVFCDEKFILKE